VNPFLSDLEPDKNKGRPEPVAASMSITTITCVRFGRLVTQATTNAALL
jgi:hypothetical protein